MRKIFIDGGANSGTSIQMFLDKYPGADEFEIYSFECNPELFNELSKKYSTRATLYQQALSSVDTKQDFYIGNKLSSSLRQDKTSGDINKNRPIKVEAIDISKFITSNFSKEDFIILKLDIEGAEYDVIPHLIDTSAITYVNELFGEWHYLKLKNISEDFHNKLVSRLNSLSLPMKEWCAERNRIGK